MLQMAAGREVNGASGPRVRRGFAASRSRAGARGCGRPELCRRSGRWGSSWFRCRRSGCAGWAAAARAGLAEAAMDGHLGTECGDALREFFLASATRRSIQRASVARVAAKRRCPFFGLELVGERDGRESRGVENLVGVGVAHAADEARIGEGALEGAVFQGERRAKTASSGSERKSRCRQDRCRGGPVRRAAGAARRGVWSRLQ